MEEVPSSPASVWSLSTATTETSLHERCQLSVNGLDADCREITLQIIGLYSIMPGMPRAALDNTDPLDFLWDMVDAMREMSACGECYTDEVYRVAARTLHRMAVEFLYSVYENERNGASGGEFSVDEDFEHLTLWVKCLLENALGLLKYYAEEDEMSAIKDMETVAFERIMVILNATAQSE